MFYGLFCTRGRLNGPTEFKDETPFRYAHAEIQTHVVVICDPTRYLLDDGGAQHGHRAAIAIVFKTQDQLML